MTSVRKWDHHCVLARRAMARRLLKEHLVLPTLDRTTLTRALLGTPSIIAQKWRRLDVERDHWVSALDCRMRKTHRQVVLAWRVVNLTLYLNAFYVFPEKAPQWFTENPETRAAVDKLLKTDTTLKEQIQRLKAKRSKPNNNPKGSKDSERKVVEDD